MIFPALNKENAADRLFQFSVLVVAFCIPFAMKTSTYSLVFLAFCWLIGVSWNVKKDFFKKNFHKTLPFLFFAGVLLLGFLNTSNFHNAFKQLEKSSSLVIIPLILASCQIHNRNTIISGFIAGCFCSLSIDLGVAAYNYWRTGSTEHFYYWNLTSPFHLNPIYISAYLLFAEIILIHYLKQSDLRKIFRYVCMSLFVFFFICLLLLASKMAFLCLGLITLWAAITTRVMKKYTMIGIIALTFSGFIFIINTNFIQSRWRDALSTRSISILKENTMNDFSKVNGLTLRLLFWKWAILEMADHPLLFISGVGTGDAQDFLNSVYENHNLAVTFSPTEKYGYYEYDSHNEYIQSLIKNGIAGITSVILLFVVPLRSALKERNSLLVWLCVILLFFCLSESIFETNKGIVFTSFFISLFFVNNEIKPQTLEHCNFRNQRNSK
jgi:O-antigen ligase